MSLVNRTAEELSVLAIPWFNEIVPEALLQLIGPFSLLIIGYLVEENYVGRVVTFSNAVAINLFLYARDPAWYLALYANLAIVFGVLGIFAYESGFSLPGIYYRLNWAFSSITVGATMIAVLII